MAAAGLTWCSTSPPTTSSRSAGSRPPQRRPKFPERASTATWSTERVPSASRNNKSALGSQVRDAVIAALPTEQITFLFSDIEGSTRLWERQPEAMAQALARHDALLRGAIETHGGRVFKTIGDAFCAVFPAAADALAAVVESQAA